MVICLGERHGERFVAYNGDCREVMSQLPDACIGHSVYSPPFGDLFTYSDSVADLGNSSSDAEFFRHYGFVARELLRVMKPGRVVAVHCSDLPTRKWKDGFVGLKPFSDQLRDAHERAGFIFYRRVTIWKCPVVEQGRTHARNLLYGELCKDSAMSAPGLPDYLMVFRTPGDNEEPIKHTPEEFPLSQWQEWASPVWMTVDQTNVLGGVQAQRAARDHNDERHVCLAEGSLVLTRERGYVPIESTNVGDHVLTHLGRWKPVTRVVCNGVSPVVRTCAQGVANLVSTPDHRVWARVGKTEHQKSYAKNHPPQWLRVDESKGSYLNLPLPPPVESNLTAAEWWMVGRWLGDGHRGGHRTSGRRGGGFGQFIISCAHGEALALVARLGPHAGHVRKITATQIVLIGLRKEVRDVLLRCGEGAQNKVLPPEALALDQGKSEALLSGYLSADGHYVARYDRYCSSSVSRCLLLGMAIVAQRARGVVASVYAGRPSRSGVICGRSVNMKQDWVFAFRNSDGYRKSGWIGDDGAWKKVRKIDAAGTVRVWDITVEEDASFVAEGAVVHNCPLQLDVIRRSIIMWSNPGETVLSPFMGIGSEGYVSLQEGRKFVGIELKESYWQQSVKHLSSVEGQACLFNAAAE